MSSVFRKVGKQIGGLSPAPAMRVAGETAIGAGGKGMKPTPGYARTRMSRGSMEGYIRSKNTVLEGAGTGYSAKSAQIHRNNPRTLKNNTPRYGTIVSGGSISHYTNNTLRKSKSYSAISRRRG